MAKHTPGPWAVNLDREFILGGDTVSVEALTEDGKLVRREICSCMLDTDSHPDGEEWLEDAANARLIAAAPTMLETLEEVHTGLQHHIEQVGDFGDRLVSLIKMIDTAIARATGT